MGGRPLRSPTHRRHGGPLHRHLPNGTHGHPAPPRGFPTRGMPLLFIRGINLPFGRLVPCAGQVPYALRTRAPVAGGLIAEAPLPLDLHVLGLSLAFILSQDQTLRCCLSFYFSFSVFSALRKISTKLSGIFRSSTQQRPNLSLFTFRFTRNHDVDSVVISFPCLSLFPCLSQSFQ